MKLNINIPVIVISLIAFSCEDIYIASLDGSHQNLVVEAMITNDPQQNVVKLFRSYDFYGERIKNSANWVTDASVIIRDENGEEWVAQEKTSGNYWLNLSALPGCKYQLEIEAEGEIFRSEYETMPPHPRFESFRVLPDTLENYVFNPNGDPELINEVVCRSVADIPLPDRLQHHLFNTTLVLEYGIFKPGQTPVYMWKTFHARKLFDIVAPKPFSKDDTIPEHTISMTKNKLESLLSYEQRKRGLLMIGWIAIIEHYGLSEKTYHHYEILNDQMEAKGKLFDPVYPQIKSNIHCVTNPEKTVIGYFELSSFKERRFFIEKLRTIYDHSYYETDEFYDIPFSGELRQNDPPEFWLLPQVN